MWTLATVRQACWYLDPSTCWRYVHRPDSKSDKCNDEFLFLLFYQNHFWYIQIARRAYIGGSTMQIYSALMIREAAIFFFFFYIFMHHCSKYFGTFKQQN